MDDDGMSANLLKSMVLVLAMGISICAHAGLFGLGGTNWKEEVRLSDGRTVVIEREQINEGGGDEWAFNRSGTKPKEYRIRFQYPDGSRKEIEWKSTKMDSFRWPEMPLVFEVEPGQYVIYTLVAISNACEIYSRYVYREGTWEEEPLPDSFEPQATNLFFGDRKNMPSFLNLTEKSKRNSGSGYRKALKQVGPNKKVCG
jgi:hypothetical protein